MIIIKKLKNLVYNILHDTKITSTKANLKAKYEKKVIISENVVVTNNVKIGKYSYINRNSSVENCEIGNYCSISSGVWIGPHEHNLNNITTHPIMDNKKPRIQNKVIIGNDVLISLNAIILSGVTIGNGAVIGAGAVVTHDVKPYEIVGGVPAKHIGWRFDKTKQEKIEKTKWWENDHEYLISKKFLTNENF